MAGITLGPPSPLCKRAAQHLKDGSRSLILCNNKISDDDMYHLAQAIKSSSSLRCLSLFDAQLSLQSTKLLCSALASQDSNLTMLDLGHNRLGCEGVEAVCNALIHNGSLLTLGLANVGMGDKGAALVADVVRMNCTLTEVYLNSNNIQEEGARELAGALVFNDRSQVIIYVPHHHTHKNTHHFACQTSILLIQSGL
jgi:Ran GTPase-activating protein (RanGAP) involved in mRNA processing and transport